MATPFREPVIAKFTQNSDFYGGDITVRVPTPQELQAAGIQPLILEEYWARKIDWSGIGQVILGRAIDLLAYVPISIFPTASEPLNRAV